MRWLWMWIGGSITRVAGTGLVIGVFSIIYGAAPWEAWAALLTHLPTFVAHLWFRLVMVVLGLVVIGVSLHFNVWSLRQQAIDDLAEDVSWAIHHLLNRGVESDADFAVWEADYRAWCERVSRKLEHRAFFTRADQLHFDRLGVVPPGVPGYNVQHARLMAQLGLKFERLRDIINWTQMRRR